MPQISFHLKAYIKSSISSRYLLLEFVPILYILRMVILMIYVCVIPTLCYVLAIYIVLCHLRAFILIYKGFYVFYITGPCCKPV